MDEPKVEVEVSGAGEGEPSATDEAAAAAVATAGAAVALANETAAHAELQAAEEVAEVKADLVEEGMAWRTNLENLAQQHGSALATISDRLLEIDSREAERSNASNSLLARLDAIEERLPPLTPPDSTEAVADATEQTEEAPVVGTDASVTAGPAEVSGEVSLAPTETRPPTTSERRRVPRRWI